jgi:endoglucanase
MIHLNQTGYAVFLPKKAVITGKGENCFIISADNSFTFRPSMTEPRFDEASADMVRIVDFTDVNKPGAYFLFADGLKKTFFISEQPYRALTAALVKGLYYQRCGCALEAQHAGSYKHACCHTGKASLIDDNSVVINDISGGWHDAGDYGRYTQPGAVTVSHMLYAYELFPESFCDDLNIPESANSVPDILNECRWELEWLLKMQRADGGVYHKVTTRFFAPFIMPEDDKEELFLFRVTHTATASFAAVMAQSYRIFKKHDNGFAEKMLSASVRAWDWLAANPVFEPFVNPPNVSSGGYGDENLSDEIFWASCELYAAVKEKRFFDSMLSLKDKVDISKLGWRDVGGLGALCCLFAVKDPDAAQQDFINNIRRAFLEAADNILCLCEKSGYRTALESSNYKWGSTMPVMCNAIILICAKLLTGKDMYEEAALAQLDYLLGANATGCSFVTGFGENAFRYPHHRPSYADGIDAPVPGLVSGGPNKNWQDQTCKDLIPPDTPAAKFYIDHTWTASANEIAIYWNSPAIFAASYFNLLSLKFLKTPQDG